MLKRIIYVAVLAGLAIGGYFVWQRLREPAVPAGFAAGNGRLEATEIAIATKLAGRVTEVPFKEGDTVDAGQIVARIDPETLEAQLRQAEARIKEAQNDRKSALSVINEKKSEYVFADKDYQRSKELFAHRILPERDLDYSLSKREVAKAAWQSAQSQAARAKSSVDAATAESERLKAEVKDSVLRAPIRGRIQHRLAELGEVLPAGGKVYSLLDLSDVYMYVFVPSADTGKIEIGSEGRILLDGAPEYPIVAKVTYLSAKAQFTPKTVETSEERHNLMFRVKLQLDPERLRKFEPWVKVGLPGMGYVRTDQNVPWPPMLEWKPVDPSAFPWKPIESSKSP